MSLPRALCGYGIAAWVVALSSVVLPASATKTVILPQYEVEALANAGVLRPDFPAAVFVFKPLPDIYDVLQRFDSWFQQRHRYKYPIYAIAVMEPDEPTEVVTEVIRQRAIKLPVYRTASDLLDGTDYRVYLLTGRDHAELLASVQPEELEQRANEVAEAAGLQSSQLMTDENTSVPLGRGDYVNTRYRYSVHFPEAFTYKVATSGDGAVAKAPRNSSLDLRVWATENNSDTGGNPGSMTMPEYLKRHLSFVAGDAGVSIALEKRFVVRDDDIEGRDYTYSYSRRAEDGGQRKIRGRVQVFDVDGVFKVASAEGLADEFNDKSDLIEKFISGFRPILNSTR